MDPDGNPVRVGHGVRVRHVIQVSMGSENCYRSAIGLAQKALDNRCGVHPSVDDDAFIAVRGAN